MNRNRLGAVAWISSALLFIVQFIVAIRWPDGYSFTRNAISDLGVTVCGEFSEQGQQVREVCSPWHSLFNSGLIVSGTLMLLGAVLLYGWWATRGGKVGTLCIAAAGVFVALVGLVPWDVDADLHDSIALGQAAAQWIGMVLIAISAGRGVFRRLTIAALGVSITGFVLFIAALEGVPIPLLGFGGSERLSFDTLTLWIVLAGVFVARAAPQPTSQTESLETAAPDRLRDESREESREEQAQRR